MKTEGLPFTPALALALRAAPRVGVQAHGAFLTYPRLSLVRRPWVQDIEGANANDLCNASSVKPWVAGPAGKVLSGWRVAGAKLLRRFLNSGAGGC